MTLDVLSALMTDAEPVPMPAWTEFWDRLGAQALQRGEASAVLAALARRPPDKDSVLHLVASLAERRGTPFVATASTVNVVGTGGGPATFNVSTCAALVAAAMGVPVLKTGSRAYTSRHGSHDVLERLGIRMTRTAEETADDLDRHGIAFPGNFVYPRELGLLAGAVHPLSMRQLGRIVNVLGPLLPGVAVHAQVTGVSDVALLPTLQHVVTRLRQPVWLCTNTLGADELLSFAPNLVVRPDREGPEEVDPAALGLRFGALSDLSPQTDPGAHLLAVLAGTAGPVATETVSLNAAALALAAGRAPDWAEGLRAAKDALRSGAALDLLARLRSAGSGGRRG